MKEIPFDEWLEEGIKLFGKDRRDWKFVCPSCGHVQSIRDFEELNKLGISDVKPETVVFFSCIGRFDTRIAEKDVGTIFDKEPKRSPCNYTNGGLFCLAIMAIIDENNARHPSFDFYREPAK